MLCCNAMLHPGTKAVCNQHSTGAEPRSLLLWALWVLRLLQRVLTGIKSNYLGPWVFTWHLGTSRDSILGWDHWTCPVLDFTGLALELPCKILRVLPCPTPQQVQPDLVCWQRLGVGWRQFFGHLPEAESTGTGLEVGTTGVSLALSVKSNMWA